MRRPALGVFDWFKRPKKPKETGLPAIPPEPGLPAVPPPPAGPPAKPSMFDIFGPPAPPSPPPGPPAPPLFSAFGPPEAVPPAGPSTFERLFPPAPEAPPPIPLPPPPAVDYRKYFRDAVADYVGQTFTQVLEPSFDPSLLNITQFPAPEFTLAEAEEFLRQFPGDRLTNNPIQDAKKAFADAFQLSVHGLMSEIMMAYEPEYEKVENFIYSRISKNEFLNLQTLLEQKAVAVFTQNQELEARLDYEIHTKTPPEVLLALETTIQHLRNLAFEIIAQFRERPVSL